VRCILYSRTRETGVFHKVKTGVVSQSNNNQMINKMDGSTNINLINYIDSLESELELDQIGT
jgi:hypothetical protein